MKVMHDLAEPTVAKMLADGKVGIIPTDTLYGIVASIAHPKSVERLYAIRNRDSDKACIILAANRSQITDTAAWQPIDWRITKKYWPGPVSMVLPITDKTPRYLTRGWQTPPYRVPDFPKLRALLQKVGPIVAPSANPQTKPPAKTIKEAQEYFGESVDFYVDGGELKGEPSTLIKTQDGKVHILRQGKGRIDESDLVE
jgi:L-threonylcarbamoyladenylate synthase